MRKFYFFLLALIFISIATQASQKRKVLFIGIDGCRSDALQQANAPNIHAFAALPNSLSTYNAWCLGYTFSGPTWSSMMTGVWWNKHDVNSNSYTGSNFNQYPYFTTLAKQIRPELYCAEVCEWPPLIDDVYNDNFNLRLHTPDGQGPTTVAAATPVLLKDSLDFAFVYFDQVDLAGHSTGFDPNNPSYMQAIANVDSCVGVLLSVLRSRPDYANEDWVILMMTDHGGIGKGHGGNSVEERNIWWIANGDDLQRDSLTGVDPGTYNPYIVGTFVASGVDTAVMHQTPVHTDIAVTALHHLIFDSGINPMDQLQWGLDGKSWIASSTTAVKDVANRVKVNLFPNPANTSVKVSFANDEKLPVSAALFDMQGREVRKVNTVNGISELTIDINGLPAAQYQLRLQVGKNTVSKSLSVE